MLQNFTDKAEAINSSSIPVVIKTAYGYISVAPNARIPAAWLSQMPAWPAGVRLLMGLEEENTNPEWDKVIGE